MSKLAQLVEGIVGERSVQQVADEWGVPYWLVRDMRRGRIKVPRDPDHRARVAAGLGLSEGEFLQLAFAVPQEATT